MATTTNYNWTTPDDTALVKDGAAAIRSLGTAIDSTVFTNAGAAIPKTLIDAKGDLIVGSAADTAARLASSASNGNVLTVDTSTTTGLKWSAPASGGKVLQVVQSSITSATTIATTTLTDTGITLSITPTLATSKVLVMINGHVRVSRTDRQFNTNRRILRDATAVFTQGDSSYGFVFPYSSSDNNIDSYQQLFSIYLDSPATTSATTYKLQANVNSTTASLSSTWQHNSYPSVITLMEIGA